MGSASLVASGVGGLCRVLLAGRVGSEPYDKLDARVHKLLGRPDVQGALDKVGVPLHTGGEKRQDPGTNDGSTDPMTLRE